MATSRRGDHSRGRTIPSGWIPGSEVEGGIRGVTSYPIANAAVDIGIVAPRPLGLWSSLQVPLCRHQTIRSRVRLRSAISCGDGFCCACVVFCVRPSVALYRSFWYPPKLISEWLRRLSRPTSNAERELRFRLPTSSQPRLEPHSVANSLPRARRNGCPDRPPAAIAASDRGGRTGRWFYSSPSSADRKAVPPAVPAADPPLLSPPGSG